MAKAKPKDGKPDLKAVAEKLADFWKKQQPADWAEVKVEPDVLADGLSFLIKSGFLEDVASLAAGDVPTKVISALSLFKTIANVKTKDGVLGADAIQAFRNFLACAPPGAGKPLPATAVPSILNSGKNFKDFTMFYFVDPSIEGKVPGGKKIIETAIQMWQLYVDVQVVQVDDTQHANVHYTMSKLDGPGGVLGQADVAGPGEMRKLTCEFDILESWTEQKFRATACHETGHMLGLGHTEKPGQLMNSVLRVDGEMITTPQDGDIAEIRKLWRPNKTPSVSNKSADELEDFALRVLGIKKS